MTRSYAISILGNRKICDTFDTILNCHSKIIPGTKITSDDWWSFSTRRGNAKLKFKKNKSLGILNYVFIDQE